MCLCSLFIREKRCKKRERVREKFGDPSTYIGRDQWSTRVWISRKLKLNINMICALYSHVDDVRPFTIFRADWRSQWTRTNITFTVCILISYRSDMIVHKSQRQLVGTGISMRQIFCRQNLRKQPLSNTSLVNCIDAVNMTFFRKKNTEYQEHKNHATSTK